MPTTRIYVVLSETGETRLIEATSQAQAIRFVAGTQYRAEVATTKDVAHGMSLGLKVESAMAPGIPQHVPAQLELTQQQTTQPTN